MELLGEHPQGAERIAILAGSFNPPTVAHLAIAEAALQMVDHVLLVLPRTLPHKHYDGVSFDQRLSMLRIVADRRMGMTTAVSDCGLYFEIAEEAQELFPSAELHLLCGRDAAERIVGWNYGEAGVVHRMLQQFRLLVAPREGAYQPPQDLEHAVRHLRNVQFDECSATLVRERIRAGESWRELVPDEIADLVRQWYGVID